ncbi:MAG: [LysW]-aminoadipate/[LysW]-glutamate kinase [Candidatus Argoarchaeum ethanivorans]|uniref:Acetylglutamate kinase n=1 Tax=Candidatus Argoarchaeum ethanivorans TaxID=2608793 RepID=A0A812A2Z4_9EURY|nr:MAG: [LysW]-aminoadipate/[LysW]-glutamate kinase [Candidatus Argoarchaeum ethanivorans]
MSLSREKILIEALPYIRRFHDTVMVLKVGGHAIVDTAVMEQIVEDIVLLCFVGIHPVIVHGGGPEITETMAKMGKKSEFCAGLRITDDDTLEIARMVLVGNINSKIVSTIGKYGGRGVGLSGSDGKLILARKLKPKVVQVEGVEHHVDLGWVGETEIINPEIIQITISKRYIPVIAPIAVDEEGNHLNINADTVAGDIACALGATKLILLTDVPGILRNASDKNHRISRVATSEIEELIKDGIITGGMLPKIRSAAMAIETGVDEVHIIDGSKPHSLLLELFTDEGIGTMIYKGDEHG